MSPDHIMSQQGHWNKVPVSGWHYRDKLAHGVTMSKLTYPSVSVPFVNNENFDEMLKMNGMNLSQILIILYNCG